MSDHLFSMFRTDLSDLKPYRLQVLELYRGFGYEDCWKPVWDDIDSLLDPKLFIGRSPELVERYCGKGGPVEEKLAPYADYIAKARTAQLNI